MQRSAKEEALLREIAKVSALLNRHKAAEAGRGRGAAPPSSFASSSATSVGKSATVWKNPALQAASAPKPAPAKAAAADSVLKNTAQPKKPPVVTPSPNPESSSKTPASSISISMPESKISQAAPPAKVAAAASAESASVSRFKLQRIPSHSSTSSPPSKPAAPTSAQTALFANTAATAVPAAAAKKPSNVVGSTRVIVSKNPLPPPKPAAKAPSAAPRKSALIWDREVEEKKKQLCVFFTKYGRCNAGAKCQYLHDPSKIALCSKFLRGKCDDPKCYLSHKIESEKQPICFFFNTSPDGSGCKLGDKCPYSHVRISPDAEVCPSFVKYGYCENGNHCKLKHTDECPEFALTGKCSLGDDCKMRHREKKKFKAPDSNANEAVAWAEEEDPASTTNNKKRKRAPDLFDSPAAPNDPNSMEVDQAVENGPVVAAPAAEVSTMQEITESKAKRIRPNFL